MRQRIEDAIVNTSMRVRVGVAKGKDALLNAADDVRALADRVKDTDMDVWLAEQEEAKEAKRLAKSHMAQIRRTVREAAREQRIKAANARRAARK